MLEHYGCWRDTPRNPNISPCGYEWKGKDQKCSGCAEDPRVVREQQMEKVQEKIQKSWAARWSL